MSSPSLLVNGAPASSRASPPTRTVTPVTPGTPVPPTTPLTPTVAPNTFDSPRPAIKIDTNLRDLYHEFGVPAAAELLGSNHSNVDRGLDLLSSETCKIITDWERSLNFHTAVLASYDKVISSHANADDEDGDGSEIVDLTHFVPYLTSERDIQAEAVVLAGRILDREQWMQMNREEQRLQMKKMRLIARKRSLGMATEKDEARFERGMRICEEEGLELLDWCKEVRRLKRRFLKVEEKAAWMGEMA